jgi:hypothetical protein
MPDSTAGARSIPIAPESGIPNARPQGLAHATRSTQPPRRRLVDASVGDADAPPSARLGGKTSPQRSASACNFSWSRRIHARPSPSTSCSISRRGRASPRSALITFLSLLVHALAGRGTVHASNHGGCVKMRPFHRLLEKNACGQPGLLVYYRQAMEFAGPAHGKTA